ncbi:MAG: hypothetical protein WC307_05435 [Candidatus Nanoarchaeia archaeon]|jgi:hypothetical protein
MILMAASYFLVFFFGAGFFLVGAFLVLPQQLHAIIVFRDYCRLKA